MILNEFEIAERVLSNQKIRERNELFVVAKYMQHEAACDEAETYDVLNNILKNSTKNYSPSSSFKYLTKMIKKAQLMPLYVIESIDITSKELDVIRKFGNPKKERLLFTLLVYAKYHNSISKDNNNWCGISIGELFKIAKVSTRNAKERALFLNDLKNKGYIELSKKNTNLNINCLFVDKDGISELKITDLRELGYQYINLTDSKQFTHCEKCGLIIKKINVKNTSTKYCKTCSYEESLVHKQNCFQKLD